MKIPNEVLERAKGMVRGLMQTWMNAAVYRTVWSLPLWMVLAIGAVCFIVLAMWGGV